MFICMGGEVHSERVKDRQRIESVLMTGPEECYTTDRYLDFSEGDDKILLEKSYTRSTLLFITNSISPALKKMLINRIRIQGLGVLG